MEAPGEDFQEGEAPVVTVVETSLTVRLTEFWKSRKNAEFYALVSSDLASQVQGYLQRTFRLSLEDCEDCFGDAIEKFINYHKRPEACVTNPLSFIWQCAKNTAIDLLRERAEVRKLREHSAVVAEVAFERAAVMLVEELVEEDDVDVIWAAQIVAAAISRLSPVLAKVMRHVLEQDSDWKSEDATKDLGMKPSTFRSNKKRGFDALKRHIQELAVEMPAPNGTRRSISIFEERHVFASEEAEPR